MFSHFSNLGQVHRLIITGREASVTLKWYREKSEKTMSKKCKYNGLRYMGSGLSKLPVVSGRELCKILVKSGYSIDYQTGK